MKQALKLVGQLALWAALAGLVFQAVQEALVAFASAAPGETAKHAAQSAASWVGAIGVLLRNVGVTLPALIAKPTGNGPGATGGGSATSAPVPRANRHDSPTSLRDGWPGLLVLLCVLPSLHGCTHRAQVRLDTTVAKSCQHAALGIALAESVEVEVCEAKGAASKACARAEQLTDVARLLALRCDPEHPAPVEPPPNGAGAPPPAPPKVPEAEPVARRPT